MLPLVPPYLCFLGGTTFDQLTGEDETPSHVYTTVVLSSIAFVLGFTTVFVILGATATVAGQLLAANLPLLGKIAGVIIIIAGLHFLGVIHLPILHREARYHADARPAGLIGAYVIGLAFAFGWTPCIGPVLGGDPGHRRRRGLDPPRASACSSSIRLASASLSSLPPSPSNRSCAPCSGSGRIWRTVEKVLGGFLVLTGILFLTNSMTLIATWMLELFPGLATIG